MSNEASATTIYITHLANASAEVDMAIDGSATSTNFFVSCPQGETLYINRLMFEIVDEKAMEAEEYGSLGASLSAGINITVLSAGTEVIATLTPVPIRTNSDFAKVMFDVAVGNFTNTTNAAFYGRWRLSDAFGSSLKLKEGQRLNVAIKDDLSGLIHQTMLVEGRKV